MLKIIRYLKKTLSINRNRNANNINIRIYLFINCSALIIINSITFLLIHSATFLLLNLYIYYINVLMLAILEGFVQIPQIMVTLNNKYFINALKVILNFLLTLSKWII